MDLILELLIYPNVGLIAAAVVLLIAAMIITTPNNVFSYKGGEVHADLNSGTWALVYFLCIVVVAMQAAVLFELSGTDYKPFSGVHTDASSSLLDKIMPTLEILAAVYASGLVLMPVAWSMFNTSYVQAVKHLLRATTGYNEFEQAVIMELREKLIELYSDEIVVSNDEAVNNKSFNEYKPELFANKRKQSSSNGVSGVSGTQGDRMELNIDTLYLNVTNRSTVELPVLSMAGVSHFCDGKMSNIHPLFQVVSVQFSNPYYGNLEVEGSKYIESALFLINGAKVTLSELKSASIDRLNELRNKNLIVPITSRILDLELSRSMTSEILNLINEAKREIALSPSAMSGQLAIVTFNWPIYLLAMFTSGLRRSARFFVLYFKNILKVMSNDALRKL